MIIDDASINITSVLITKLFICVLFFSIILMPISVFIILYNIHFSRLVSSISCNGFQTRHHFGHLFFYLSACIFMVRDICALCEWPWRTMPPASSYSCSPATRMYSKTYTLFCLPRQLFIICSGRVNNKLSSKCYHKTLISHYLNMVVNNLCYFTANHSFKNKK